MSTNEATIPTISGKLAGGQVATEALAAGVLSEYEDQQNTLQYIQQKFKTNERVLSFFAAYQIVQQLEVHTNRLLALVESELGGTYAIFSLAASELPPRSSGDLTIDKIFPLNDGFRLGMDSEGCISKLTFTLKSGDDPAVRFYYYHVNSTEGAIDFDTFQATIISAKMCIPMTRDIAASVLSYSWLNDYRQVGDAKQELKQREHEYMVYKDFSVYCATWNINNRSDYESPLHLWLSDCPRPPDIYAIALQELDNSANAVARNEMRIEPLWVQHMLQNVHKDDIYEHLTSVRLVGIMLTILVRREVYAQISYHRTKIIPRGLFKTLGNKGGVGVSLRLNEDRICFINSHLAAHMTYVEERNADYAGIVRGMIFDDGSTIDDHKHIFWIGDLNYRIEEKPGMEMNYARPEMGIKEMLQYDQLKREMREGRCFKNYREADITFKPTYKYDVGTDNFDSSEKQRAPAYCDRILWKGAHIKPIKYNSVMELRQSDHKPVYAIFQVQIKKRDEARYKKIHEEVLKLVDKRENENQPQITVEKTIIDFGVVRFNELAVCDFFISNNSPMIVDFLFKVKDPPLNDICEKWLKVEPRAGSLLPDTSKNVRLKLCLNPHSITEFLSRVRDTNRKIDLDILILHVKNGRDIFLTVTGEYRPSCFGLSVETLCRTDRPLSRYTELELRDLMCDDTSDFRVTMPREYFLLIDHLYNLQENAAGVFSTNEYKYSKSVQFNEICEWLDTWSDSPFPGSAGAAAEALLLILDLAEKPLLHPFVEHFLRTNTVAEAKFYIEQLSQPRQNVFMHLCMFLRNGIDKNYYNLNQVASVFGKILLRNSSSNSFNNFKDNSRNTRCRDFMHRIISAEPNPLGGSTELDHT